MADGRHIESRFLAISRRHIVRLKRNLERRWRITCRYRSRDQNSNFRQFNMAAASTLKVVFRRLGIPVIPVMNYPTSSISVPNLKRIALFVQKLLGVPKFRNRVTWPKPRPLGGRFMVLHLSTKFEADCSIPSKVIRGVPILENCSFGYVTGIGMWFFISFPNFALIGQ